MTYEQYAKKLSDKDLIQEYRGLYCAVNEVECYGTRDLMLLDACERELDRRGYTVSAGPVEIEKE